MLQPVRLERPAPRHCLCSALPNPLASLQWWIHLPGSTGAGWLVCHGSQSVAVSSSAVLKLLDSVIASLQLLSCSQLSWPPETSSFGMLLTYCIAVYGPCSHWSAGGTLSVIMQTQAALPGIHTLLSLLLCLL